MKREVKFDRKVLTFLEELNKILIENEYLSFVETSDKYIDDIVNFILSDIHTFPHRKAPDFFARYGKDLFCIFYNRNKHTTWYIFFEKSETQFLIRHISNNHVVGQYFE